MKKLSCLCVGILLCVTAFAQQKTYVLVHGAFATAQAWDAVKAKLEGSNAKVITPMLPGHGGDATDPHTITLQTYVDAVKQVIREQKGKVILVGHSMAGMIVSQVAEDMPERIAALGYIAAYLPRNGDSLQTYSSQDAESEIGPNLQFASDYSTCTIRSEAIAHAVCADCPQEVKDAIVKYEAPEPLYPFNGRVRLSHARFGRVRKYYLHTTADKAVSYSLQKRMVRNWKLVSVRSVATGHLPFITDADGVAAFLQSMR